MGSAEKTRERNLPAHELAICQRFREIREKSGLSQGKFAKELNIPIGSVSFYEYGKTALGADIALRTCFLFLANERWLATGEGDWQPCVDLYQPEILVRLERGELYSNAYNRFLFKEHDQLETIPNEELIRRLLKSDINTEERLDRIFEYTKYLFQIMFSLIKGADAEMKMTDRDFLLYFYNAGINAALSLFKKCGLNTNPIIPVMRAVEGSAAKRKNQKQQPL